MKQTSPSVTHEEKPQQCTKPFQEKMVSKWGGRYSSRIGMLFPLRSDILFFPSWYFFLQKEHISIGLACKKCCYKNVYVYVCTPPHTGEPSPSLILSPIGIRFKTDAMRMEFRAILKSLHTCAMIVLGCNNSVSRTSMTCIHFENKSNSLETQMMDTCAEEIERI